MLRRSIRIACIMRFCYKTACLLSPIPLRRPFPNRRPFQRRWHAHRTYWRFNVALIGVLLTIGGVVSFGVPLIAQRFGHVRVAGFPLPFYVGAQGAILVYVALIFVYIVLMQFADARLMCVARAQRDEAA